MTIFNIKVRPQKRIDIMDMPHYIRHKDKNIHVGNGYQANLLNLVIILIDFNKDKL